MLIQLDEGRFCQFVYAPDYLRGFEHFITPPARCRLPFMQDVCQEPIVLEGGNVVASRTKVILTDKVYKENPTIERPVLQEQLEQVFQANASSSRRRRAMRWGIPMGALDSSPRTVSS